MTKARDLGDNAQNTKPKVVDAKGDLIVGTGSDAASRLATGSNGETLVADSSASTGLRWQGNFAAGKNKIINGDFGIWQRGTSFTTATAGTFLYTADRWVTYFFANNASSVSQQTFTPGTAPVTGYEGQYFIRVNSTNTQSYLSQRIEDVRTFAGQTVTLSFWAKSASNQTIGISSDQNYGSGGSTQGTVTFPSANVTTSWTRFTSTLTLPVTTGKTIGAGSYLSINFNGAINNNLDIWGVQLEAGNTATAFQTATGNPASELAACQRYYYRQNAQNVYNVFGQGVAYNNSNIAAIINTPTMRTTPTSVDFSQINAADTSGGFVGVNSVVISGSESGLNITRLNVNTPAVLTQFRTYYIYANNTTSGFIGLSAEL